MCTPPYYYIVNISYNLYEKVAVAVKYVTSVSCWSNCNAPSDTGYKSENRTSMMGLFLLDITVSVASPYIACTPVGMPGFVESPFTETAVRNTSDSSYQKELNCVLAFGNPIPTNH